MPLPSFLIAGERRCGTTSLYRWLETHPDIYLFPKPDMDYFIEEEIASSRVWRDGPADAARWEAEHSHAKYSALFDGAPPGKVIGQKDADLLFWRPSHPRLAAYLPDCRFIYVVRHPVTRCWSHYWNEVGKGRESLSFEQALLVEEERAERSDYARNHLSYMSRGFYATTLEDFYRHVPPARVLVLTLEEMQRRQAETLARVCEFIGVAPIPVPPRAVHNKNMTTTRRSWTSLPGANTLDRAYTRVSDGMIRRLVSDREQRQRLRMLAGLPFRRPAAKLEMSGDVRRALVRMYRPHVQRLEALLGRELGEWAS